MYKQLQQRGMESPPTNISMLRKMKEDGLPIACLTAYDASFAQLVDMAGADVVLVGDSLGMVVQGHDTTVPVSSLHVDISWSIIEFKIFHCVFLLVPLLCSPSLILSL